MATLGRTRTSNKHFVRFGSPDSIDANYGSDAGDIIDEQDCQDIDEVADWLLQPVPPSPKEGENPFDIFSTPGAFLYQLFHIVLVYFNLLPPCAPYPILLPRKSAPRLPPPQPPRTIDGKIFHKIISPTAFIPDDETEYVIHPTPGTNQHPIHIPVTNDISYEKLRLHKKGMLRIYRVSRDPVIRLQFSSQVLALHLSGDVVRMPVDEDDTVAVFRHGYRLWDFFQKDEVWYLVATNTYTLREVIERCQYVQPRLAIRLTKPLWRTMRWILSVFVPWMAPPGRPINRPPRPCQDDFNDGFFSEPDIGSGDWTTDDSDSDSDSDSD
ncbi:hypothetical protein CPB84DRAFT_1742069 [Gymnopilus junonius]|uniref:Uncharacterized protein n=1 Tax=Gymnopilus junonius TaxID=109634 RepID=A0A9P5TU46_GYMJU|nr:hypothetical protein CPB84DRAFT_1742069 [Gymnopilus junonius]